MSPQKGFIMFFIEQGHKAVGMVFVFGFSLSLIFMAGVVEAKPQNITDAEMLLIPRYCPDTMGFNYGDAYHNTSPNANKWVGLMGKGFWAVHHYCWALIDLQRALRHNTPPQIRQGLLESVLSDYRYVVNNVPPDFILLPEILTRIGEVEIRLSHPDVADQAFSRARELKPDYWPAYSHWIEYLIKVGRRSEALKVVRSGLSYSPNAKVLLEQYRLLGGKLADIPKPVVDKSQEVDSDVVEKNPEVNQFPEIKKMDEKAE